MTEFSDFNFSSAEEISQALAQRLKSLRIHKEIAQAEMAKRMGVSRSSKNQLVSVFLAHAVFRSASHEKSASPLRKLG